MLSSWRWVIDPCFDFQSYDLFHYPCHWNESPAAFLRPRVNLDGLTGERVLLTFEGFFGWMLRLEQQDGVIAIPNRSGHTWFLTGFIETETNRDPSHRESGVLPDSSIVPDLWIEANSPLTVVMNGQILLENANPVAGGLCG